jgi:type II secretory pathway component PulF
MLFNYEAKTQLGESKLGTLEASSEQAALEVLQRNGLIVLELKKSSNVSIMSRNIKIFDHVPQKEIVIFSRQISALFEAKVPIIESLRTMAAQTENQTFKDILEKVTQSVDSGNPLSKALSEHKKVFTDFYISIVHSGELSGNLEEVFNYLADTLENEYYLTQKVKGAMTYPIFIVVALIGVMFVMMIWVIPNLTSVFKEANLELPLLTRIIVAMSDIFQEYWWLILIVIVGVSAAFLQWITTSRGRVIWSKIQLRLPVFGVILKKLYLSRFADSLSTLIKGGLPIVKSLEVTSMVVGNGLYKTIIEETIGVVKKGGTISSVFKSHSEIPIMVSQMIYIGEQAGKLDSTLKTVAKFYHKEVESSMDNLVALIEPLLILVLGVGVGILLVAILMPMYNLTTAI